MLEQIKDALQRNKLKKIVALVLSTALWFFVMGSQDPVINGSYDVPITMMNVSSKYKALYKEEEIRVKLSAPRSFFVDYSASSIRAFANMANYSEGEYDVPIETTYPKGFELEGVSPEKIHVQLDPFIEKQIPAELIMTGTPAKDSVVTALEKSSNNLTLIGSKTAVESVKRAIGYIGLNGNAETFDIPVPMTAIDEDGREVSGVRVAPSVITVTVEIEQELTTKIVPVNVNITPPAGREISRINFMPEVVEITGGEEALSGVSYVETAAVEMPAGENKFTGVVKLVVPEGVVINVDEVNVTAELKE